MKLRLLLCAVALFGLANVASATIVLTVNMNYAGSYDADFNSVAPVVTDVLQADETYARVVDLASAPTAMYHSFDLTLSVTGLAADQDIMAAGWKTHVTGSVLGSSGTAEDMASLAGGYTADEHQIDPLKMPNVTGGSNAPPATWDYTNFYNGTGMAFIARWGTSTGGTLGNTYGDYMAYLHIGETEPFTFGNLTLTTTEVANGSYSIEWPSDMTGYLKLLTGNINGTASSSANEFSPVGYIGKGDSVQFVVPEPSTLALLGCGLFGLLAYAWRKRK